GTDQEQPFNDNYGAALQTAIQNGTIPQSALNTMLVHVFTEMFGFGLFNVERSGSTSSTVTTPAHVALAAQVAQAGTTLLKNAGATLPLAANGGSVAVIGPSASASPTYAGGGSAYVIPSGTVTPLAGIRAAAGSGTNVVYQQGL